MDLNFMVIGKCNISITIIQDRYIRLIFKSTSSKNTIAKPSNKDPLNLVTSIIN